VQLVFSSAERSALAAKGFVAPEPHSRRRDFASRAPSAAAIRTCAAAGLSRRRSRALRGRHQHAHMCGRSTGPDSRTHHPTIVMIRTAPTAASCAPRVSNACASAPCARARNARHRAHVRTRPNPRRMRTRPNPRRMLRRARTSTMPRGRHALGAAAAAPRRPPPPRPPLPPTPTPPRRLVDPELLGRRLPPPPLAVRAGAAARARSRRSRSPSTPRPPSPSSTRSPT
jgi:hypothetical protein